jgi:hypothetical protein
MSFVLKQFTAFKMVFKPQNFSGLVLPEWLSQAGLTFDYSSDPFKGEADFGFWDLDWKRTLALRSIFEKSPPISFFITWCRAYG